ncbi:uncharacterized protein BDR25DRAFT_120005 [Lindgomyces ingoldianus]|uniref:Uncharacterized protein n=1 Tax=Lindgomyces ingoldianus TaxID=673940 RepID=A0ACB6R6Q5_9PLEO|nr:uncharacterized protein BDR25DRAFT_120005 [Lindgomyces ingoldianus]KAF2474207.1 hypothetical protein BDR25DRAFT_120005 [Lindgomyces ingoldianus]
MHSLVLLSHFWLFRRALLKTTARRCHFFPISISSMRQLVWSSGLRCLVWMFYTFSDTSSRSQHWYLTVRQL